MKKLLIFLTCISVICLFGCKKKPIEYEVTFIINNEPQVITLQESRSVGLGDIEPSSKYEYLGLYLDEGYNVEYQNQPIIKDAKLYVKSERILYRDADKYLCPPEEKLDKMGYARVKILKSEAGFSCTHFDSGFENNIFFEVEVLEVYLRGQKYSITCDVLQVGSVHNMRMHKDLWEEFKDYDEFIVKSIYLRYNDFIPEISYPIYGSEDILIDFEICYRSQILGMVKDEKINFIPSEGSWSINYNIWNYTRFRNLENGMTREELTSWFNYCFRAQLEYINDKYGSGS